LTSRVHVERAARILLAGGVIAYPTEAVFGLGCLPQHRGAVERLLAIKRRSWRKGLLLIGADLSQLTRYVLLPEEPRRREILASWPGAVTWVLNARPGVPRWVSGVGSRTVPTVAVRLTDHPLARALCERLGHALISTSANLSGRPPLKRALQVRRELGRTVDYVLPGQVGGLARPTAIKDGRTGRVLRAG
jgi:L-threonylcarbamoyladenylate synthase